MTKIELEEKAKTLTEDLAFYKNEATQYEQISKKQRVEIINLSDENTGLKIDIKEYKQSILNLKSDKACLLRTLALIYGK